MQLCNFFQIDGCQLDPTGRNIVHSNREAVEKRQSMMPDLWSSNVAYVRPVEDEGTVYYTICSPDGRLLALAPTRELAFALTKQNDFKPCDAH